MSHLLSTRRGHPRDRRAAHRLHDDASIHAADGGATLSTTP
jgi:hypothetical protein